MRKRTSALEYCDEIMDMYPEQRLRGVFKEIYDKQERPTEEIALDNLDKQGLCCEAPNQVGVVV